MSIKIINSRTPLRFGNGLPFYKFKTDQIRYKTNKPYFDGLSICPSDRVPTFQFKVPDDMDGCFRFNLDDGYIGSIGIGTDDTNYIIKRPTSDGEFLYISADYGKGLSNPGIYYLAFRNSADPAGEYRYYSEQFKAIGAALSQPCIVNGNPP